MNLIKLDEITPKPNVFHEYNAVLKAENTPLVIDNGSYKCRVGWSNSVTPLLEFRNLIAKPRKDRKKDATDALANPLSQIGNEIASIEQFKTQFDRDVVTHFENQERIFDYIFAHLNIDNENSVPHPILLTEALGNPNYSRQQMTELLFECYGVPAISYGIDSLFSWYKNKKDQDGLVLSFGYSATHVIPLLSGRMRMDHARRLNVGGFHITNYLYRLMQMKYPVHLSAITANRIETLIHHHSSVAVDYQVELRHWADVEFYTQNVKKIQLPYTAPVQNAVLTVEQKIERRKELAQRLISTNARRSREKQLEGEQQLHILRGIRNLHECGEVATFRKALLSHKLDKLEDLDKHITCVEGNLERLKQKLQVSSESTPCSTKKKSSIVLQPPPEIPIEKWISDLKVKRIEILKQKHTRKIRRQEIAKRHTVAAQERMRIISLLARNEKGTDEFGINDNDWDVYKVINRENDSDSETENEKLIECDNILRQYDPNFVEQPLISGAAAEHYQLHVGVECIRAPELIFQPSMIGNPETGLSELIQIVLKQFSPNEQQRLVDNIFMTGGCAQFPGLKNRLSKELLEMRPFQTTYNIYQAQSPELDAWFGARCFAESNDFNKSLFTNKDYEEFGSEYFKMHRASNYYFPSPR